MIQTVLAYQYRISLLLSGVFEANTSSASVLDIGYVCLTYKALNRKTTLVPRSGTSEHSSEVA